MYMRMYMCALSLAPQSVRCVHAKARGMSAIYLGSVIQLIFGLMGRRYLDQTRGAVQPKGAAAGHSAAAGRGAPSKKVFSEGMVNEHWRPPLASETPPNFKEQEGGAYWRRR